MQKTEAGARRGQGLRLLVVLRRAADRPLPLHRVPEHQLLDEARRLHLACGERPIRPIPQKCIFDMWYLTLFPKGSTEYYSNSMRDWVSIDHQVEHQVGSGRRGLVRSGDRPGRRHLDQPAAGPPLPGLPRRLHAVAGAPYPLLPRQHRRIRGSRSSRRGPDRAVFGFLA